MKFKNFLLIQPMHEKADRKERSSFNFPWGIAYLSSYIKAVGCNVQFLDGQVLQLPKEELAACLDRYDADIIGISAFSTQYNAVRYLSKYIKEKRDIPVVVGGPLATYQPRLVLETTNVDICVIGEGEFAVVELLNNYDNLEKVAGVAFKKDANIVVTQPQKNLVNLDELLEPDFDIFDMEKYLSQHNAYARKELVGKSIMFITSRGCPYNCNFCSKSSRYYRSLSPKQIFKMLKSLKDRFGINEVSFGDELFLISKKKFQEIAPKLETLNIRWGAQARINLMDKEFLAMIKRAGCIGIGYGIESGSQKILNNMNKQITVEQIETVMNQTKRLKIPVKVQLIFGYPGEDETTIQDTIDLFRRIDHPGRRFNVIVPLPGSSLYSYCIREGLIKNEPEYLCAIEKSFGIGKVHVNFTQWPDDEIYPRKYAAEEAMKNNYRNNSRLRKLKYFIGGLKRASGEHS
ncbi:MAG: B12-binding domain-containing radical SAM protein [Candidatus Omnitrophota bacterium]|nr:MAG: B12-binding domain-containing radical SAM protein [Candidatus Omnitrophota bacterium]